MEEEATQPGTLSHSFNTVSSFFSLTILVALSCVPLGCPSKHFDEDFDMLTPTPIATQQFMDPRRNGEATSDLSDADLCDILCILHPASASSVAVCAAIAEASPDNTVSRASIPIRVRGATPGTENAINTQHLNGTMDQAERGIVSRDIALRLSADLKDPLAGYTFGRNPERCDFVINPPSTDGSKRISNIHFRIWFTEQSNVIMLEDQSTNGTWVEGKLLRAKHKESGGLYRHILVQGTLIRLQMIAGRDDDLKFVVRIPSRETGSLSQGLDEIWERNVQAWFENLRRVRHGREEEARKKEGRATGQTVSCPWSCICASDVN